MVQVTVRKKCPKCTQGEMKKTNRGYTNSLASYWEHVCEKCGHQEQYKNESFPYSYFEFEDHEKREEWK